jgi:hypothetical protein
MSIKRSKPRTFDRDRESDSEGSSPFGKAKEAEKTWSELVSDKPDDAFVPYALTTRFTKGALVSHSKFGKGVVTGVDGVQIQVLFESGTKKLGHAAS